MANVDGEIISKPNFIKFKTGQRVQHWSKNCVAIGLSAWIFRATRIDEHTSDSEGDYKTNANVSQMVSQIQTEMSLTNR